MQNRLVTRAVAWLVFIALAGCGKPSTPSPSSTTSDNSAAAPPSNTAQNAPQPAPVAPVVVAAGKVLVVTVDQEISTKTNRAGDRFDASLAEPVTADGNEVIPAGSKAFGTVTESESAGHLKGSSRLAVRLDSISVHGKRYSIETASFEEAGKGRGKRTIIGGGGGAVLGAVEAAIAGGGKGAAIGAAAGGGAGTAGAAFTGKRDITIPAETRVHFRLTRPLKIQQE